MAAITVDAKVLRHRLGAVIPHADPDDIFPALSAVHFEIRDGELTLMATDRFTLAVARVPGEPPPEQDPCGPVLLDRWYARELRRLLKGGGPATVLVSEDGTLTVKRRVDVANNRRVTVTWDTAADTNWPPWRTAVRRALAAEPAELGGEYALNLSILARFQALDWREPAQYRITAGGGKDAPVIIVAAGDWFLGLAMPVRLAAARPPWRPDWSPWEPYAAPEPAAAK